MDSKSSFHHNKEIENPPNFVSLVSNKFNSIAMTFIVILGVLFIPAQLRKSNLLVTEPAIKLKSLKNKGTSLFQSETGAEGLSDKNNRIQFHHKHNRSFDKIISQAADQYKIDAALIKAIIMAESGYNPNALSKKGAMGLMQLMPNTAKWLGVEDGFNPEHNINGGVKYFKHLMKNFDGDVKLALAAYNAGSKNVHEYQGVPPFQATRYYITKVFKYYNFYKNQT